MNDIAHTITITRDGIWYRVRVTPPCPPFDFSLDKRDGHYARSYARTLSRQRKWPLVDLTGEAGV